MGRTASIDSFVLVVVRHDRVCKTVPSQPHVSIWRLLCWVLQLMWLRSIVIDRLATTGPAASLWKHYRWLIVLNNTIILNHPLIRRDPVFTICVLILLYTGKLTTHARYVLTLSSLEARLD